MIDQVRGEPSNETRSGGGDCHLTSVTVLLAVILFLSRGFLHILVVPMWEGFDEPFHYAYVQHIAEHGWLPPLSAPSVSQEILESLQLFPTTYHLSHLTPMRFKNFWELSPVDRLRSRRSLDSIEPASRSQLTHLVNYQTQHPPLYYLLCAPVYLISRHLSLVDRVFILRSLSLLLAAISLPLGYLVARRIFKSEWALLIPALMAVFPNYYVFIGRVTNDALAVVLFPALLLASGRLHEKPGNPGRLLIIGLLLALGLLTKFYFVTAVPVLLIALLLKRFQEEISTKACALALLLVLAPTALVAGWWYMRNYVEVGAISGLTQFKMISSLPATAWIEGLPHFRPGEFGRLLFRLHVWAGNWSFLTLSKTYYQLFEIVYALCGIGVIRVLMKHHPIPQITSDQERESRYYLMLSSGFLLSFMASMVFNRLSYTVAGIFIDPQMLGGPGSEGWYLHVLLSVEAILLFLGIHGLVRMRAGRIGPIMLLGLFFILDQAALWGREIPYYAGLSIRVAHPFANPAGAVHQVVAGLTLALHRVASLGPHWSSQPLLLTMIVLTVTTTATSFVLVYHCLSRPFGSEISSRFNPVG